MRLIFLNRYFYPDHSPTSVLLSDLAFALSERGVPVTVITSRLSYEGDAPLLPGRETIQGVEVHRVWTSKRGRSHLLARSLDYGTFYLAAAWRLWRIARATDIIVAKTDPPLLSVLAALITSLRKTRLVNWLQDLFPEAASALNVGGRIGTVALRLALPIRNWSLRLANTNVVVSARMAARLEGEGIPREKIRIISNWSDGALITPIPAAQNALHKSWALNDRFVVGYAGNLGRAHDVDTIVEAMALLHERATGSTEDDVARRIVFVFVGGGAKRAQLEQEILRRHLTNAMMRPYQPRQRLAETLSVADLHLVSLHPELEGLIVPSKFYGIAAAGRPTLFIGAPDGEIARLIDGARCGFTVAFGNGKALMDRILQLASDPELCASMGGRARATFERQWNKERAIEQWEEVLNADFFLPSGKQASGEDQMRPRSGPANAQ
jgi:colanic acid biosynthesis glycosyl transferase WcaI